MKKSLEQREAEAILFLSGTHETNWSPVMGYIQRQLESAQKELEEAVDMHAAARFQGECRAYRKVLGLAQSAQTMLNKSR